MSSSEFAKSSGGTKAVGRAVHTVADLDEVIQAGLPRAALEHLMGAVAPESERAKLRNPTSPFGTNRWLEIFLNPYPDPTGEHSCVVSTKNVAGPPFRPDDAISKNAFDGFCESPHITQILVGINLGLPAVMAGVVATAAATLGPLNAIPIVGPFLYSAALAAIVTPYTLLQTALVSLLAKSPQTFL